MEENIEGGQEWCSSSIMEEILETWRAGRGCPKAFKSFTLYKLKLRVADRSSTMINFFQIKHFYMHPHLNSSQQVHHLLYWIPNTPLIKSRHTVWQVRSYCGHMRTRNHRHVQVCIYLQHVCVCYSPGRAGPALMRLRGRERTHMFLILAEENKAKTREKPQPQPA